MLKKLELFKLALKRAVGLFGSKPKTLLSHCTVDQNNSEKT